MTFLPFFGKVKIGLVREVPPIRRNNSFIRIRIVANSLNPYLKTQRATNFVVALYQKNHKQMQVQETKKISFKQFSFRRSTEVFFFGETSNEWGVVTCTISSQKSFVHNSSQFVFNVIHEFPHKFVGKNEIKRVYFHWHVYNVWAIFLKFL